MTSEHNRAQDMANTDDTTGNPPTTKQITLVQRDEESILEFQSENNHWRFVCTAAHGGRIISFQLNNREILVPPNESGMFGSTFWTSPESWGWPPPTPIDEDEYNVTVNKQNGSFTMVSPAETNLNVRVHKTFSVDAAANAINVEYAIENIGVCEQKFAPWEISRVERNGLTFFPKGNRDVTGVNRGIIKTTRCDDGIVWYQHSNKMTDDAKLFNDGKHGWIAHTDGNLLLIKQFTPAQSVAPGEAEIEIYACPNYVEVEQQGTYAAIAPNEKQTWKLRWYLRSLPKTKKQPTNKTDLLNLVKKTLADFSI